MSDGNCNMSSRTRLITTRRSFLTVLAGLGLAGVARRGRTVAGDVIDVRAVGAFGNGKASDLAQIQQAIRLAAERPAGATVFFPPGEYYLGASDDTSLLPVHNLRNTRFVGERATISCKSVNGASNMFVFSAARDVTVEGLTFRDRGFKRDLSSPVGAVAIRLANEGSVGCENVEVKNCRFESVLSAVTCRSFDQTGRARTRDIRLTNLSVQHALYGFNFQDHGDRVTGRGLRCSDVKRSYFPYGVSDHDIELETTGNATGFTDVTHQMLSPRNPRRAREIEVPRQTRRRCDRRSRPAAREKGRQHTQRNARPRYRRRRLQARIRYFDPRARPIRQDRTSNRQPLERYLDRR